MMKPLRNLTAAICLTFAVLLGSAGMSWSADFQKGVTAYQSGDYATALRELVPLAKQGNARAQSSLKGIKTRLVTKGIDGCLFDEIAKVTGPETKKIVEKYCRNKLEQKSLDWLVRNAD
jgi:hypothetical protein